jgi:uncharacterized membrane protein
MGIRVASVYCVLYSKQGGENNYLMIDDQLVVSYFFKTDLNLSTSVHTVALESMKISVKKMIWTIVVLLAILVGFIPLAYISPDSESGFLELKDKALLQSIGWKIGFNAHIISGGIAIMIGWVQFSRNLLAKYIKWHRAIGKVYVVAALICGLSGIYVGFHANGGPIAAAGFISVAIIYFYTTLKAYLHIKNKQISQHQAMMMYSYSACLAAVTLRLYVPLLTYYLDDYLQAYRIAAWLSWIPNLIIAQILITQQSAKDRTIYN